MKTIVHRLTRYLDEVEYRDKSHSESLFRLIISNYTVLRRFVNMNLPVCGLEQEHDNDPVTKVKICK